MKPTTEIEALDLHGLSGQFGAVFNSTPCYQSNPDEPRVYLKFVRAGEIAHLASTSRKTGPSSPVQGTGSGLCEKDTFLPALAEGLERYSACMFRPEQFRTAAADEL